MDLVAEYSIVRTETANILAYPTFILVLVKSQHAEHVQNDLNNLLKKERSLVADLKDALVKEKSRKADVMDELEKEKVHTMSLK